MALAGEPRVTDPLQRWDEAATRIETALGILRSQDFRSLRLEDVDISHEVVLLLNRAIEHLSS